MIMMVAVTLGRAGSAVTRLAEVVVDLGADPLAAADRASRCGDVIHPPVAESAARRIGIVDDQSEAFRPLRRFAPAERRGLIDAIARELDGDRLSVLKGIAGQAEFCEGGILHGRSSICPVR